MRFFGDAGGPTGRRHSGSHQPLWSWAESLAVARPGGRYRVTEIVYSLVRDRCEELSIRRGDELRCLEMQRWALELEFTDGRLVVLERDYAWFIQVEPVAQSTAAGDEASS